MRGFRYKYGDKPLEGYTIQRAAGRGGFGEVYYALSDSGREVALKVIQGYEQIELRGVSQCMNLKSPHLVTIFDVRHNNEGVPFVIMEFVSGPSLRQLLDECPSGLGAQKAAFFLREIGKGLSYLHECGIVHRDLKPGNIFYENGSVKIGDYGLSKAIAPDHHSGQTITVGTVHYMAPEIGKGSYDRGIDIYAMGAMLYEMLTGQVPYLGGSPGEILMKHMTAEPDVSNIEEPFATVIKRSMARDPEQRYKTVQEMVEAVFGAEHIQQSVSCFSPESLSLVAERVAQRVAVGGGSATPPPAPQGGGVANAEAGDRIGLWADRVGDHMVAVGDRLSAVGDRIAERMSAKGQRLRRKFAATGPQGAAAPADRQNPGQGGEADANRDPISRGHRKVLALSVLAVMAVAAGFFADRNAGVAVALAAFTATAGAAAGIRLAQRKVLPALAHESVGFQRLAQVGLAVVFMSLLSWPALTAVRDIKNLNPAGTALAALVAMFLTDWTACARPGRLERLSFRHAIIAAILGWIFSLIFHGCSELVIAIMAGTSLMVQVSAPWDPFAVRQKRSVQEAAPSPGPAMVPPAERQGVAGNAPANPAAAALQPIVMPPLPPACPRPPGRRVPHWARYLWLALIPLFASLGIVMLVVAANTNNHRAEEFALICGFGVGLLLMAILCLVKTCQCTFRSWWCYLVKPLLLWACAQTTLISGIYLGNSNPRQEEVALSVFFIVFPAILLLILAFVRFRQPQWPALAPAQGAPESAAPPAAPLAASSATSLPVMAASGLLALIGWLLFLASIAIGLAVAIDIPGMIAAGLPDPQIARQLNREFGGDHWPRLLRMVLNIVFGSGLFIATVLLMAARRWSGAGHMLRAIIGTAIAGGALGMLSHALSGHWMAVANSSGSITMAASIAAFLDRIDARTVFVAAFCMLFALAMLFWPASRRFAPAPQA